MGWPASVRAARTRRFSAAGVCLFSRFPRRFELASLGSLSDPVGCARTARQWRNLHPPPAAPTPSSSDGWNLGPNAGRVRATVLCHLAGTEVIKQEVRKYTFNVFICSFNDCDVIVPISLRVLWDVDKVKIIISSAPCWATSA